MRSQGGHCLCSSLWASASAETLPEEVGIVDQSADAGHHGLIARSQRVKVPPLTSSRKPMVRLGVLEQEVLDLKRFAKLVHSRRCIVELCGGLMGREGSCVVRRARSEPTQRLLISSAYRKEQARHQSSEEV